MLYARNNIFKFILTIIFDKIKNISVKRACVWCARTREWIWHGHQMRSRLYNIVYELISYFYHTFWTLV